MKVHVNLATRDLQASVAYYSTLLNAPPVKILADYALFVTETPGLELALDLDPSAQAAPGQHFGLAVDATEAVDEQISRLSNAGYATDIEREETCCYAKQTKVWSSDPEGRRWETYVVLAETEERDDEAVSHSLTPDAVAIGATCCP
jgi:catechol 2,3-dioxygenase-like lactoylglutathione lyase family enzyme